MHDTEGIYKDKTKIQINTDKGWILVGRREINRENLHSRKK